MASTAESDWQDNIESKIAEEYRIWKKNSPFLYDVVLTHLLEWPSLTVSWLPVRNVKHESQYAENLVVLGTQTSGAETDYLMIARVLLPTEDCEIDARHFDEERGELGQYGGSHAKIEVVQKIVHPGDVHRARHCPQKYNLIATKSSNNEVLVYDYFKHESTPRDNTPNPQFVLLGHDDEGYGVNWSPVRQGYIASAGDDNRICIWDINATPSSKTSTYTGTVLDPLHTLDFHKNVVEDIAFHPLHQNVFGSVSDDQHLFLWDLRDTSKGPRVSRHVSNADVMSMSFNQFNEHLLATSSSDNLVRVWDTRAISTPVHTLVGHEASVNSVAWAPYSESVLVSSGEDRRTMIWDCSRIGAEQSEADAEDGPPELIFVHGGHMDKVSDVAWSANEEDPWFLATVSEDNVLHVWQPAENLIYDEDSDDDSNTEGEEEEEEKESKVDPAAATAGQSNERDESAEADAEKDRKLKKMRLENDDLE